MTDRTLPLPTSTHSAPPMRGIAAMLLLALMWGLSIPVTRYGPSS